MDAAGVRRLTISLLGRPRCKTAEASAPFPARPGNRALFVALAFARRPLERTWIAAALWPDVTNAIAGANLRRHVSYVERWLQELTGATAPIVRTRSTLALEPAIVEWLDISAFEDAVGNGALAEAASIYGGDLLTGLDDEWISAERQRLRGVYDEVLLALVEAARARHEVETALRYAQMARANDPYNEAWLRTSMRVRYTAGDRAGALREFETYRAFVATDLDVEPLPETVMLADSMRRLEAPTSPAAFAFESTTFVGRMRELRMLAELVARERLVTISGEPGAGKSRLALRCVRSHAATQRDGAVIIDTAGANDAQTLRRNLERALAGRAAESPGDSIEELVDGLDAVLYLDGCERIAGACAEFVGRILAAAPQVRVVTSSRIPLGVSGEAAFRLGPLDSTDAARLFIERVQVARPDAMHASLDRSAIARICSKVDRLPLAIELAAARTRVSTLAQVVDDVRRYSDRPGRDVLYATYESSYDLLAETERAVLRRLAAFAKSPSAGIAIAACADLAPEKDLQAALTTLVEHSLVVPPGVSEVGARYSLLDATRDFALYRARALGSSRADARATALAVARHYVAIGRRLRAEFAASYYPEVERDHENIEAALATLWRGDARDRDLATDLSLAVSRYWADQGFAREGERQLRKALDSLTTDGSAKRLELLRVIGTLTRDLGDYASSFRDFCELVRAHERAHSSPVEIAKAQTMAANAARMMGAFDEALTRTQLAYAAFVELGEAYLAAWAVYAIGTTLLSAGRFNEAQIELERATDMFNETGAVADSSSSIANLALCHYYQGRFAIAHELTRESLHRATDSGHRYYYAHAALNEALILHALGEDARAWPRVVEASAIGLTLSANDIAISCAEIAAALLAATQPAAAALILGSVDSARERAKAPRFPVDLPHYDDVVATLRAALGDESLDASRARGRVTPLRDAVTRFAHGDRDARAAAAQDAPA